MSGALSVPLLERIAELADAGAISRTGAAALTNCLGAFADRGVDPALAWYAIDYQDETRAHGAVVILRHQGGVLEVLLDPEHFSDATANSLLLAHYGLEEVQP